MRQTVPILMYHQVTPRPSPTFQKYEVTVKAFSNQLRWLAWAGYTPINLDSLLNYYRGQGNLPAKPIVITFDDGFEDCIKYTVPILQRYDFTATYFLVAGLLGNTSRWLTLEGKPEFPMVNLTIARQLSSNGFEVGSHTINHPRLAELPQQKCYEELYRSRQLLSEQLGQEIKHLAYPFGSYNAEVQALVAQAGYQSACSVRIGFSNKQDDWLALHRIPILGQDSLVDFVCRLRTTRSKAELVSNLPGKIRQRLRLTKG